MRLIASLFILGCLVSLSPGQYVETTILLPDSTSGLTGVGSLVYHSPNKTIYVGGNEGFLVIVDAQTDQKLKRVAVGSGPHLLCSDSPGNKVYCSNSDGTITVIDGATNQPIKTFSVGCYPTDLCYNAEEHKLYCGNMEDSLLPVIDCRGDSVVARVLVSYGPGALCCNTQLDRVCCTSYYRDAVIAIDCAADTLVDSVWVQGVQPQDICYDSATNCVYTANTLSNTVSAIDCAGDTLRGLFSVGREPGAIVNGPPGKVYCANHGNGSVSAISSGGVKMIGACTDPWALSYDSANKKLYCAGDYFFSSVTVIDAVDDTAEAQVAFGPNYLCYNPAGNNTYAACSADDTVSVIGGQSDTIEKAIAFGPSYPGSLCYNTVNDHLYCLDPYNRMLFVIDGNSNRVIKTLNTQSTYYRPDALILNQITNKAYVTNFDSGTVSVLDCTSDSIIATARTGSGPRAPCCGADGKVYVVIDTGVAVIDGSGDTVRTVVSIPAGYEYPSTLCHDRTDRKMYVGTVYERDSAVIRMIDENDSVRASIVVSARGYLALSWSQNHDKLYVGRSGSDTITVIDCAADTVIGNLGAVGTASTLLYADSSCDKVYCAASDGFLRVIQAATNELYLGPQVGSVGCFLDNGKQGPANRLYCSESDAAKVAVIRGYKMDSIICQIPTGMGPAALAWNPAYSRMYVSNRGSSSISVIRDTIGVGVEVDQPQASSRKPQATVVRGALSLPPASGMKRSASSVLLDISGRKVIDLRPGANDVRALAPGVYFVREAQAPTQARAVRKVVVTR